MWLFACVHQGIAGGAVVARIGDGRLSRQLGQGVDFASNGRDHRRIDRGDRLQIDIEPRLGGPPLLCERASCVTAESIAQYFRSPKCLLAALAFLTTETSLASSARLREVADQFTDQQRGGAGEDRQQQNRQEDQPCADRETRHQVNVISRYANEKGGHTAGAAPRLAAELSGIVVLISGVREHQHVTRELTEGCLHWP